MCSLLSLTNLLPEMLYGRTASEWLWMTLLTSGKRLSTSLWIQRSEYPLPALGSTGSALSTQYSIRSVREEIVPGAMNRLMIKMRGSLGWRTER
jgi:hypothetical protein